MFELGFAARQLGFKALVGVVNEAFGKVEGQVFDIKRRACLRYMAIEGMPKPKLRMVADKLSKDLERIIRGTIESVVIPKRNRPGPEAQARQQEYVTTIRGELQTEFGSLVQEASARNQGANYRQQPAFWECVIRPSLMSDHPIIDTLAKCRLIVRDCQIGPSASPLPDLSHSKVSPGPDWIEGRMNNYGLEYWRMTQKMVFAAIISVQETEIPPSPQTSISLDDMILRLTQVFRFAAKLAEKTARGSTFDVDVRLGDIGNRPLLFERSVGRFQFASGQKDLSHSWHCSREELQKPDLLAVKAAYWFCERFNWEYVSQEILVKEQERLLRQM